MRSNRVFRVGILIIITAMIFLCFTACGDSSSSVKAAAEGLLGAIQKGDLIKAADLTTEEAATEGDLSFIGDMRDLTANILSALGLSEEDLSGEAKGALDDFREKLVTGFIKSYKVTEVEEEENTGYAACTITYGYDPDSLETSDFAGIMSEYIQKYTEENKEELQKIMQEEGQDALIIEIANHVIPDTLNEVAENILSTGEKSVKAILKVENTDGIWLVTEAKISEQ